MKKNKKIAIVGAGNIGVSIAMGLFESRLFSAENILLTRRRIHLLEEIKEKGFTIEKDNIKAIKMADIIIIAVEPQQIDNLLKEINEIFNPKTQFIISVVTGVSINKLRGKLGKDISIIRAMPNTAIAVHESMTCIATDSANGQEVDFTISLFESVGSVLHISEEQMNAATSLCACGIAFFLQAIRAASQGGIEIGFNASNALVLATQTAKGAARLLNKLNNHPSQEIDKVTTPKGCTITGLNQMEHEGFSSALIKGIKASAEKAALLYPKTDLYSKAEE